MEFQKCTWNRSLKVRFHHHIFATNLLTNLLTKLPYSVCLKPICCATNFRLTDMTKMCDICLCGIFLREFVSKFVGKMWWWKRTYRGRLFLHFGCAFWMCSKRFAAITCVFGMQQNKSPICSMQLRAAHRAASSAMYVFNVRFQCAISMCIQTAHKNARFAASSHGKLKYLKQRLFRPTCVVFLRGLNRSHLEENRTM
jgi:hypothetical protein